jgi:hypothetical protein
VKTNERPFLALTQGLSRRKEFTETENMVMEDYNYVLQLVDGRKYSSSLPRMPICYGLLANLGLTIPTLLLLTFGSHSFFQQSVLGSFLYGSGHIYVLGYLVGMK